MGSDAGLAGGVTTQFGSRINCLGSKHLRHCRSVSLIPDSLSEHQSVWRSLISFKHSNTQIGIIPWIILL